jgi:hypothetical protein
LACYKPKEEVEDYFYAVMKSIRTEGVEKRIFDPLVKGLVTGYWSPVTRERMSPIVTYDGWVFWLFGAHERFLRALAQLYSNGETDEDLYSIKQGYTWYMSGEERETVLISRTYPATHEDKSIFKSFKVWYID